LARAVSDCSCEGKMFVLLDPRLQAKMGQVGAPAGDVAEGIGDCLFFLGVIRQRRPSRFYNPT